jgi:hypothetical protein
MHQFTPFSSQFQALIMTMDDASMTSPVLQKGVKRRSATTWIKRILTQQAICKSMQSSAGEQKLLQPLMTQRMHQRLM